MLRKLIATAIFMALISTAYSQDSTKTGTLTISGSVDAYYRFNFANAKDSMRTNNYTSFTNSQNSFELGMASLTAAYSIGKVEALVDLGFGTRAEEFSYAEPGVTRSALKQGYLSYAPSENVKFSMGKWATHVGYELLDAYLNRNYSMDYMFSFGPFSHTGIKMDVTASKNFAFMLGVANPTDMISASFAKKSFLAQVHVSSNDEKVNGYVNFVGGKDLTDASINQIDAVITGTISDKFSVGYNGTVKSVKPMGGSSDSWWGSALYLNVDPTSMFGLTLRGEYFGDKNGVAGFGTDLFDVTLSANIHIDNLTIIPEFRVDTSKDPIFYKNTDMLVPTSKGTGSFILAATYHF
ncbi:MAG: porin [Bacteroidia bacterium]|nr:porin [Bacteroidia bacterium]